MFMLLNMPLPANELTDNTRLPAHHVDPGVRQTLHLHINDAAMMAVDPSGRERSHQAHLLRAAPTLDVCAHAPSGYLAVFIHFIPLCCRCVFCVPERLDCR
jgi:hypothetical protein